MGRHIIVNSYIAILVVTIVGSLAAWTIVRVALSDQSAFAASTYETSALNGATR